MNNLMVPVAADKSKQIWLAFAGIYLIWGTTYLAIAIAIQTLPPFTSGSIRFLLAAALLYAWLRSRTTQPLVGINFKSAALCGVLLTGFGNGFVIWAQQGVPSGIAALIVAAIPIFILLVEWLCFGGKLPNARAAIGMLLALSGVAVIVVHTHSLSGNAQPLYVAAILIAVLAWSFGTLLQRQAVQPGQVLSFTCAQIFFGGLAQTLFALLNREWQVFDWARLSLASCLATLYLIVFGTLVALNCYLWLLTQVSPQKVATYALVNPAVALLLGAAILGERITLLAVFAALGVLLGIGLVLFQPKDPVAIFKSRASM